MSILVLQSPQKGRESWFVCYLSYRCVVTINVLWLFLTVPWVGLLCVTVVFPDHSQFLDEIQKYSVKELLRCRFK